MSTPPVETGEEQIYVADNVDEHIQRVRWNQILEAREQAREALRDHSLRGAKDSPAVARETVNRAVEAYVVECEPFYQRTEPGQKLWTDTEIASVPVRQLLPAPPTDSEEEEVVDIADVDILGEAGARLTLRGGDHRPAEVVLGGVRDYLEIGDVAARYTYKVALPRRGKPTDRRGPETTTLRTPVKFGREVLRATNALLNHIDTGFEINAGGGDVGNDYSDLLERIDE